jgi:hypothetical protein
MFAAFQKYGFGLQHSKPRSAGHPYVFGYQLNTQPFFGKTACFAKHSSKKQGFDKIKISDLGLSGYKKKPPAQTNRGFCQDVLVKIS